MYINCHPVLNILLGVPHYSKLYPANSANSLPVLIVIPQVNPMPDIQYTLKSISGKTVTQPFNLNTLKNTAITS